MSPAHDRIVLAVPSKGRLMEEAAATLARAGLELLKPGAARGYRGSLKGVEGVDVAFVSAIEIARFLRGGQAHLGITGEDLIREEIRDAETRVSLLKPLGFGQANVVVAVPQCWLDVRTMRDLEQAAAAFRRRDGRRLRVATKYLNLARRFFAAKGIGDYRLVESLGATEGTPASGTADLIVDITTTGATLAANALKVLDDGVILRSQANLVASRVASRSAAQTAIEQELLRRLGVSSGS